MVSASRPPCFIRLWSSVRPTRVSSWEVPTWMWTRSLRPISGSGIWIDALLDVEHDTTAHVVPPSAVAVSGTRNLRGTTTNEKSRKIRNRVVPVSWITTVDNNIHAPCKSWAIEPLRCATRQRSLFSTMACISRQRPLSGSTRGHRVSWSDHVPGRGRRRAQACLTYTFRNSVRDPNSPQHIHDMFIDVTPYLVDPRPTRWRR
jgi:hypothetical protein